MTMKKVKICTTYKNMKIHFDIESVNRINFSQFWYVDLKLQCERLSRKIQPFGIMNFSCNACCDFNDTS